MVSPSAIGAMIFTLGAAFFLPIILVVVFCAARRLSWRSVLAGFFFYALMQSFFRLPFLWLLYRLPGAQSMSQSLVGNGILMGLTAVIFETAGRFLGGRLVIGRKGRKVTAREAVGYGLGHSIAETFFLMGLTHFSNLMLAFSINQNGLSGYGVMFGQAEAAQVYQVLTKTPALDFAAGGVERTFYTIIQICLTGLVFYGLRQRRWKPVLLAALAHFMVVFGTALLQPHGVWMGELYILLMTVLLAALCLPVLRRFWNMDQMPVEPLEERQDSKNSIE